VDAPTDNRLEDLQLRRNGQIIAKVTRYDADTDEHQDLWCKVGAIDESCSEAGMHSGSANKGVVSEDGEGSIGLELKLVRLASDC
jgi:hypothetical protein